MGRTRAAAVLALLGAVGCSGKPFTAASDAGQPADATVQPGDASVEGGEVDVVLMNSNLDKWCPDGGPNNQCSGSTFCCSTQTTTGPSFSCMSNPLDCPVTPCTDLSPNPTAPILCEKSADCTASGLLCCAHGCTSRVTGVGCIPQDLCGRAGFHQVCSQRTVQNGSCCDGGTVVQAPGLPGYVFCQ